MAKLFFSYSHRDEGLRKELEVHLSLLKREGLISTWHDRRIEAGGDIHGEISVHLEDSDVVLLLVSADFLGSDYCFDREMKRALEREKSGECTVIPVILRPCDWKSAPFGHLRATPTDGRPVVMYANQDEAFSIVAKDIRSAVQKVTPAKDPSKPAAAREAEHATLEPARSSNLRVRREFSDQERDEYLDESFEYMARFFEGSLNELQRREPHVQSRFRRIDLRSFSAALYEKGQRVAQCSITNSDRGFGKGIAYSNSETPGTSYNELLTVSDDGITLSFKPLGMSMRGGRNEGSLSVEGAAEHFWAMLIQPLQE